MKKTIFILFVFLSSCHSKEENKPELTPEEKIYSLVNFIIDRDLHEEYYNCNHLNNKLQITSSDSEAIYRGISYFLTENKYPTFIKAQFDTINYQISKHPVMRLDSSKLHEVSLVPGDSLNKLHYYDWYIKDKKVLAKTYSLTKCASFYRISYPIFLNHGRNALVFYQYGSNYKSWVEIYGYKDSNWVDEFAVVSMVSYQ